MASLPNPVAALMDQPLRICLREIPGRLHSQPHIGTASECLFKTQSHHRGKGASALYHVVKLLARDLHRFRGLGHTQVQFIKVGLASAPG